MLMKTKRPNFIGFSSHFITSWANFVLPTEFGEELVKNAHEISESEAVVGDHSLDLVELGQMGGVQGFVSEHPVDWEILDRCELLLREAAGGKAALVSSRFTSKVFKCKTTRTEMLKQKPNCPMSYRNISCWFYCLMRPSYTIRR